ncbi:hypothetical protein O3M35_003012 [Rhynocoris fuscipes]|uniref:Band 7 domain-containing protein n=1 Tax=Rhynocoris fuscipes TaxID=488301 RepID=A0AAW1CIU6_9HEMI
MNSVRDTLVGPPPTQAQILEHEHSTDPMEKSCVILSYLIAIAFLPISLLFTYRVARQYERVLILRLGKLRRGGARGPGLYFVLPCVDQTHTMDIRTIVFDIFPYQVLTKDSCTIKIDVTMFCRIVNPIKTVVSVTNFYVATLNLVATSLRNIIGQKNLAEFLSERDAIVKSLKRILDEGTAPWGVKVISVEIMGVCLPKDLQRSMASEAEASREARAKLVAAEGELLASKALSEASNIMVENPVTIHLRYLQTLLAVASNKNSTIIFPLPTDLLKRFLGTTSKKSAKPESSRSVRSSESKGSISRTEIV